MRTPGKHVIRPHRVPMTERFWRHVDRGGGESECWPWSGAHNRFGHGNFLNDRGEKTTAHRVAWEFANGPIPVNMCVCHRCDNPPCCNPAHLFLGTRGDNANDMAAKGRAAQGERHPQRKLTTIIAGEIRQTHSASGATFTSIAARFGVGRTTVADIVYGKRWLNGERV